MTATNGSSSDRSRADVHSRRPRLVYCVTAPTVAVYFLRGQLKHMVSAGWDVTLGCSPGKGLDVVRDREGVEVVEIVTPREISPFADLKAVVRWIALLRRIRPDVLNVSTPKGGLIGALAGWWVRVPKRVYVVRGLRYESESGLRRRVLAFAERVTIACATDIVAVSPSVREELTNSGLLGRKSATVIGSGSSNGVDATAIQQRIDALDRQAVRQDFGITDPSAFVVAFIGRLRRDKGVPELVAAMASEGLRDAHLLTVGDIEDAELGGSLSALGSRWHSVDWLDDVAPALLACDSVCLPTHREGFPNTVLEAAAAGVSVVTTTATGARDSVIDGVTGLLVPVFAPTALAEALTALSVDPGLRERLGAAAKTRVLQEFAPADVWRGLEEIYRSNADGDQPFAARG